MTALVLILSGLAAWFLLGLAVALVLGPVLARRGMSRCRGE